MVVVLLLCGTRCFGATDYFAIEDEVFFVHTMFYHFWFIPLCPMESFVSKMSDTCGFYTYGFFTCCNKSYVVRLPQVEARTVMWAWARILTFLLPLVPIVLAIMLFYPESCGPMGGEDCLMDKTPVLFIVLLVVGCCLFLLWPLSMIYKPKASPDRKEKYLQAIKSAVAAKRARANAPQVARTAQPTNVPQAARMPQPNMQQAAKIVAGKNKYRPLTDDTVVA